ncbi:MAG: ribosome silencing factor [Oscillospiraceae bacterium]|nr:ribosome silencing factor [Oscillospiraceae bacterium]MBP1557074.1 ribosome silencing factor [Oscillospiraceae bacterium]MBP1578082.1 ribosome silencing factor [Oscillospiraceae bacterium]
MTTLDKAKKVAQLIDNKKGEDVRVLHIGTLTTIGDYFVVATGNSTTQVKAFADEVDEKMSAEGLEPKRIEGYNTASWILMDYDDVIVHLFLRETREFYALERLWGDAPEIDWE